MAAGVLLVFAADVVVGAIIAQHTDSTRVVFSWVAIFNLLQCAVVFLAISIFNVSRYFNGRR